MGKDLNDPVIAFVYGHGKSSLSLINPSNMSFIIPNGLFLTKRVTLTVECWNLSVQNYKNS